MLNLLLSGMRPIFAAAKLLLFCHLGKFFALFFHKTAEIVAFTPFSATISSPFQPIDTPSAAPVSGAEIMDGSRGRTDAKGRLSALSPRTSSELPRAPSHFLRVPSRSPRVSSRSPRVSSELLRGGIWIFHGLK